MNKVQNKSRAKELLFILVGLILIISINYFIFDLTGLSACRFKYVDSYKGYSGNTLPVRTFIDLDRLFVEMQTKPNILLIPTYNSSNQITELKISKFFSDIEYRVLLTNDFEHKATFVDFDNNNYFEKKKSERCTEPDIYIKKKMYSVINELPVSNTTKQEFKYLLEVKKSALLGTIF